MAQTILDKYAAMAREKGGNFLSPEEEQRDCLLWQQQRDEKALERLIIDKAMLVYGKTHDLRMVFGPVASVEDIGQWAVEGIQHGIEEYPAGKTEISLNSYVLNGARWNIFREVRPYLEQNYNMQRKAEQLLHEEAGRQQRPLTVAEQETVLASLSPSLKNTFFARQKDNTQTLSDLGGQISPQHLSADDRLQDGELSPNEVADRFPSTEESSDPYQAMLKAERHKDVMALLDKLPKQMKQIMIMRYGVGLTDRLCADESKSDQGFMTFKEIGEAFGVTKTRIRHIEDNALKKLRKPMLNEHLASYMGADVSDDVQIDFEPVTAEGDDFAEFFDSSPEPE